MFNRFTDRARRAVALAEDEAWLLNHKYIGTGHLLLGLIHEGEGVAGRALRRLGISLEAVRYLVIENLGEGQQPPNGRFVFDPRARKALELSLREALRLDHRLVGTEHILLGLVREKRDAAAQVLVALGADPDRVRQQVIRLLPGSRDTEPPSLVHTIGILQGLRARRPRWTTGGSPRCWRTGRASRCRR